MLVHRVFHLFKDFGLNPPVFRVFLSRFYSYEKIFPDRFWFSGGLIGSRGLRKQGPKRFSIQPWI